jgi:hypothetical protein
MQLTQLFTAATLALVARFGGAQAAQCCLGPAGCSSGDCYDIGEDPFGCQGVST